MKPYYIPPGIPAILLLMSFALLTQCRDSEQHDPIVFGESHPNYIVQDFDTLIRYRDTLNPGYPFNNFGTVDFDIDLDLNEESDIRLTNGNSNNKWGIKSTSSLSILSTAYEVAVLQTSDSVLYCGYSDTNADSGYPYYDTVYYTPNIDFTCQYTSGIHKVSDGEYPVVFHLHDSLSDTYEWVSGRPIVLFEYQEYWSLYLNEQYRIENKIRLGINSLDQDQYIAIRKLENEEYRFGWIKIGTDGGPFIRIKEAVLEN